MSHDPTSRHRRRTPWIIGVIVLVFAGCPEQGTPPPNDELRLPFDTTDKQLALKLKGRTELNSLFLVGTKITDAGAKSLNEVLPKSKIRR